MCRGFDIAVAHMADGARQEAASSTRGIKQSFTGLRVDAVNHKGGYRARRVIFPRIARRLQVIEDLLVDIAKMLALGQIVEIDLRDLVNDLAHQLAGFHIVVSIFKHIAHDATPVARPPCQLQPLECGKQLAIDKIDQGLACYALGIRCPVAPLQWLRQGGAIVVLREL